MKLEFFEDLCVAVDWWVDYVTETGFDSKTGRAWVRNDPRMLKLRNALASSGLSREEVAEIVREWFNGLAHSFLVVLDGGTELAEKGRLHLIDDSGRALGEGLHEQFMEYMQDRKGVGI